MFEFHQRNMQIRDEMIPWVNFTNILQAAFTCPDSKRAKNPFNSSSFLRFWDLGKQKLRVNTLIRWDHGELYKVLLTFWWWKLKKNDLSYEQQNIIHKTKYSESPNNRKWNINKTFFFQLIFLIWEKVT